MNFKKMMPATRLFTVGGLAMLVASAALPDDICVADTLSNYTPDPTVVPTWSVVNDSSPDCFVGCKFTGAASLSDATTGEVLAYLDIDIVLACGGRSRLRLGARDAEVAFFFTCSMCEELPEPF